MHPSFHVLEVHIPSIFSYPPSKHSQKKYWGSQNIQLIYASWTEESSEKNSLISEKAAKKLKFLYLHISDTTDKIFIE